MPLHPYIGKRAIQMNDFKIGVIVEVHQNKDHERWDTIMLDYGGGGHRHYIAIEGEDFRFFGIDMFTLFYNKYLTDDQRRKTNTAS